MGAKARRQRQEPAVFSTNGSELWRDGGVGRVQEGEPHVGMCNSSESGWLASRWSRAAASCRLTRANVESYKRSSRRSSRRKRRGFTACDARYGRGSCREVAEEQARRFYPLALFISRSLFYCSLFDLLLSVLRLRCVLLSVLCCLCCGAGTRGQARAGEGGGMAKTCSFFVVLLWHPLGSNFLAFRI
jgi:hypothetical protein